MQRRQITLADGRYLIFYTFDEGPPPEPPAAPRAAPHEEGAPQPQAEEERHV